MDDLVLTPMSVFCAELAQKVQEERHVRLMFFCGLVHEREDKTLEGSTIIRAVIYQIIQQNMGFFTAREVDSMYGDFNSILESQNLPSTDLCVMFSGLVRLAERSLNQRKKKMICIIDGLGACNNQRYRGVMEVVQALAEINKTVPLFQLICTGPLLLGVPLESFARVYGLARSETDVGPQGSTA
ncbi:hypothetical protein CNYM01_05613 [Colletotrichum nymphaeae SA-01]|uniref:Nephrocystin 3-like N-terminal domain-containing protein n=1 Tax=Colletotrichum nymphaeae SA-01 TaxID=1460502 RepID=A0A135SXV5_9PEZI|nr:hypothetical protein CNYM01_05613 [Colletotrichum nymphaeae SA-01]